MYCKYETLNANFNKYLNATNRNYYLDTRLTKPNKYKTNQCTNRVEVPSISILKRKFFFNLSFSKIFVRMVVESTQNCLLEK